jgi:ammonia channel protein AmtB
MCIGALVYWAVGFAITFGESRTGFSLFTGTSYFFFYKMPSKDEYINAI